MEQGMRIVEGCMTGVRAELVALGFDPTRLSIWCHLTTTSGGRESCDWTVFCRYCGTEYQLTERLEEVIQKLREITQLPPETREALLSL